MGAPAPGVPRAGTWTIIGTLASARRAVVDPRGLVTATDGGWSLDWWIGADDRWHLPADEAAVRQHLVDDSPVVETAMHIPGGDAVHRAYAVREREPDPTTARDEGDGGPELVVVEIENRSPVPFAVALALRPWNPAGAAPITSVSLDGTTLMVDGRPGVLLPKPPARAAAQIGGDVLDCVVGGDAPLALTPVRSDAGDVTAAVIYPLPHTAVLRVALPIGDRPPGRSGRLGLGGRRGARRAAREGDPSPATTTAKPASAGGRVGPLSSAPQVAAGWAAQTRRGLQIDLPDPALVSAIEANRRFLLLAHGGDALAGWPAPRRPTDWDAAVDVLGALDRWGFAGEAEEVLATLADPAPGRIGPGALIALGEHWRLTRDRELLIRSTGTIAAGVRVAVSVGSRKRPAPTREARATAARGLRAAAELLAAVDQPDAAEEVSRRAAAVEAALDGGPVEDERDGPAVMDPSGRGLSPRRTLRQAASDLQAGERAALDRLGWALSVASPTHAWPELVDPGDPGSPAGGRPGERPSVASGSGHDLGAAAAFLTVVRTLLVHEGVDVDGPSLVLCSVLPPDWRGQGFEVHGAPTAHGRLSYAVRWHGPRPALLWELEPWTSSDGGGDAVALRAPGLDPTWVARDRRGEALLEGPPEPAGPRFHEQGASFS